MNSLQKPSFEEVPAGKRRLLSIATAVILSMITWCNLPDGVRDNLFRMSDQNLSPQDAYRVRYSEWLVRHASYLSGLDSKWQMYGAQPRFVWHYVIKGHYGDSTDGIERILPLPRQSERTAFQKSVVDFKEAKFLLNIYNDKLARETYARYLARQFPEHEGRRITRISVRLDVQYILPPMAAVEKQQLIEPKTYSDVIDVFDVSSELTGTHIADSDFPQTYH